VIYLRERSVISMLFHNVAVQLLIICTRGVSCAGPSQHAAYMVLLKVTQPCGMRGDCSRRYLKRRAVSWTHSWSSFRDYCRRLLSVAPRSFHRVVIFAIFLSVFYFIPVFRQYAVSLHHSKVF
jgi:hypothetical protein